MHNYEPYAIEDGYKVLIAKYHHALCGIEDYFKDADKMLVLQLIDDTSCKMLRMVTVKDAEDRDPNQFQFLLKHSIHPLVQLQVLADLCNPGELRFAKQHLTDDELYKQ